MKKRKGKQVSPRPTNPYRELYTGLEMNSTRNSESVAGDIKMLLLRDELKSAFGISARKIPLQTELTARTTAKRC